MSFIYARLYITDDFSGGRGAKSPCYHCPHLGGEAPLKIACSQLQIGDKEEQADPLRLAHRNPSPFDNGVAKGFAHRVAQSSSPK
jgi:hypothetical protein